MKVMTVVGTRPEIIRLSRVIARLEVTQGIEHVLVHTGQNYDRQLNEVFFEDFDLRPPDHYLAVDTSSLGRAMGETLSKVEDVIRRERPHAFLVLGDTNSCISAVMAKRMRIPVYHMEAGNRSFDQNVPEETNRRLVDHVSDFNLPYTEHARRNLLSEGVHPRRMIVTGSPMREVLDAFRHRIAASEILGQLQLTPKEYFLVSVHREENVDSPSRLRSFLDCLTAVRRTYGKRIVVSTHPRTRNRLAAQGAAPSVGGIDFMEPFGFHDYNKLQIEATCVLSDSGTIAEESSILGFPAITLREAIERPEALDTGSIMMTGLVAEEVTRAISVMMEAGPPKSHPQGYEVADTSDRVVRFMMSTASRHNQWAGIRDATS